MSRHLQFLTIFMGACMVGRQRIERQGDAMKTLELVSDPDIENPAKFDSNWKLYSFNSRHASYKDPDHFFPNGRPDENPVPIGLRRKLAVGTAFILSYSEHGDCNWGVEGTIALPQWDSCRIAGLLVWEHPIKDLGPKTYAERQKDAENFCEVYTAWCNGEGYGYSIKNEEGEELTSCYGFYC